MEILIPGLILVALMVYASTKIKKSAAEAYEQEMVETDEISIIKPEGFISLVDPQNGLLFDAHSKEFGYDAAGDQSRASGEVRFIEATTVDDIVVSLNAELPDEDHIELGEASQIDNARYVTGTSSELKNGIRSQVKYRWVETGKGVYQLKARFLEDHADECEPAVEKMIESFRVK